MRKWLQRGLIAMILAVTLVLFAGVVISLSAPLFHQFELSSQSVFNVEIWDGKVQAWHNWFSDPKAMDEERAKFSEKPHTFPFAGQFTFRLTWRKPFRLSYEDHSLYRGPHRHVGQHQRYWHVMYKVLMTHAVFPLWFPVGLLTLAAILLLRGPIRRRNRRRRNCCESCGYSRSGNESGICPECGDAVEVTA